MLAGIVFQLCKLVFMISFIVLILYFLVAMLVFLTLAIEFYIRFLRDIPHTNTAKGNASTSIGSETGVAGFTLRLKLMTLGLAISLLFIIIR